MSLRRQITHWIKVRQTSVLGSLIAWVLASGVMIAVWFQLDQQREVQTALVVETSARHAAARVEDYLDARLQVSNAIAHAYSNGRPLTEESFRRTVGVITKNIQGYFLIAWVGPGGEVTWVAPGAGVKALEGRHVKAIPEAWAAYTHATKTREVTMSAPSRLLIGGEGVVAFAPVDRQGEHMGAVAAAFRLPELISGALRDRFLQDFHVSIRDGEARVWEGAPLAEDVKDRLEGRARVEVAGRHWDVELTPREALRSALEQSSTALLIEGIVCVLLIKFFVFFLLEKRRQRDELIEARHEADRSLWEARKMREFSNIAGGIRHEFNNLLIIFDMNMNFLSEEPALSEDGEEFVDSLRHASERVHQLTDRLVSFGEPESFLDPPFVELVAFRQRWQGFLHRQTTGSIWFHFDEAPRDVWVGLDDSSLARALINLTANAIEAMPDGGKLALRWQVDRDVGEVSLLIEDNGSGISPEHQDEIFTPYFTTREGHRGLGLSVARGAVEGVGGRLTCSSTPGEGSVFTICLPIVATPSVESEES